jgi:aspartate aminotransferase
MTLKISRRVSGLEGSATIAVSDEAARMRSSGIDVIGLGQGEPDFPTPPHVIAAAEAAMRAGATRYPQPFSGIPQLKAAVCRKLARENELGYDPSQIIATVGGKEALWLAFATLLDPGDEVIVPAPYWVSYLEQIKLCGAVPVIIETTVEDGYKITPDRLRGALSERTRAFVFTSPSNPTGATYHPDEVRALAAALDGRDVVVFADEIYDRLTYRGATHFSWACASRYAFDHTITFNAGSKTYAMTGWRIGYAAGPADVIEQMAKLQSQTTSSAATFSMHALAAALDGDQSCVEEMRVAFEGRSAMLVDRLNAIPGVVCPDARGAFYVFPDVSGTFESVGVSGSQAWAMRLLAEAHVAVVPGVAFGADPCVRLSFASSATNIETGLDRLEAWLAQAKS